MDNIKDDIYEANDFSETEFHALDTFVPVEVIDSTTPDESRLDSQVNEAIQKLSSKFDLDKPITDPKELLNFINEATVDNKRVFDLLSSKVASEVHSRVRFKATLAADTLLDKMADLISNVDSFDYRTDPMSFLLLIEKYMDFIEKADAISEKYNDPNIDDSIANISKEQKEGDREQLTPSDYTDIVNVVLESLKKERKEGPKTP